MVSQLKGTCTSWGTYHHVKKGNMMMMMMDLYQTEPISLNDKLRLFFCFHKYVIQYRCLCCNQSLSYKGRRRWGIHPRAPRQSCRLCSQYLQWLHNFLNRKLQPDSTVLRIRALYFMKRKPCSTMAQSRSKRTRTDWWEFLLAVVNHQMSD